MTTGNVASGRVSTGTEERLIEATLELISQEGGSLQVTLRQISRRAGCAHTNVYNYFDTYGDLLWAAFRRGLHTYAEHLVQGLDASMAAEDYLRRTIGNLASFPQQNPGLYRFIGSDPIDLENIPPDLLASVAAMKRWFAAVVKAAAGSGVSETDARDTADIVLAYIDGETLNIINGRVVPDEDPAARVEGNAMRLFELLTGAPAGRRRTPPPPDTILEPVMTGG